MQGKGSMLSLLAILGLILASCAPAPAPTPTPKPAAPAAQPTSKPAAWPEAKPAPSPAAKPAAPAPSPKPSAKQPRSGGVYTSFVSANPPSLDPQQDATVIIAVAVSPFYTNLVQVDPLTADKVVPGLAEKWEISKDELTWTFSLRQGVKFHDGTLFTADDAVFNLKKLIDPPKGARSTVSAQLQAAVKSVEKDGNSVKLSLNYPFALVLDTLATYFCPMYSEKYVQKQGDMKTTAMGTGPFKLKSYTPGIGIEGVKNPDFWGKGRPYLDGYRYLVIRDEATRLSAFRTGKVNVSARMFGFRPSEMETVKKENPDLKFYPSPTLVGPWFFMNSKKAPFQDQRVRKAIGLALDRQAALKVLAEGHGIVGKPFSNEPWGVPVDELLKSPGYRQPKDVDITEAKNLMQVAGYASGFDMAVLSRQTSQSKDAAVFMTNQLAQIGIRASVQVLEDAIFWETGRKYGHDAMVFTPGWVSPDPQWFGRFFLPGGNLNYTGNDDDKELVRLWDEQARTMDPERRKALIRKVEERLLEAFPGISVVWPYSYIGVRSEVRNFAPGISDCMGNTLEEIWLAK